MARLAHEAGLLRRRRVMVVPAMRRLPGSRGLLRLAAGSAQLVTPVPPADRSSPGMPRRRKGASSACGRLLFHQPRLCPERIPSLSHPSEARSPAPTRPADHAASPVQYALRIRSSKKQSVDSPMVRVPSRRKRSVRVPTGIGRVSHNGSQVLYGAIVPLA
jgi:hypothetical protein